VALTRTQIYDRLRPFLLVNVDGDILARLTDTNMIAIINDTANDFNNSAKLNIERYDKDTGSVAAESTDTTYRNYKLQGDIVKILKFTYESADWADQYYTYTDDRVALKVAPGDGIDMNIVYLRECEDIADATDEIDLPDSVLPEFLDLLKAKFLADYSKSPSMGYEAALDHYSEKAMGKVMNHAVQSVRITRDWFYQSDDVRYDITNNWIQTDHFTTSGNDLIYTET